MFDDLTIYDLINELRTWLLEKYTLVKKDGSQFSIDEVKEIEEFKQALEDAESLCFLVLDPEAIFLTSIGKPIPGVSVIDLSTLRYITSPDVSVI